MSNTESWAEDRNFTEGAEGRLVLRSDSTIVLPGKIERTVKLSFMFIIRGTDTRSAFMKDDWRFEVKKGN